MASCGSVGGTRGRSSFLTVGSVVAASAEAAQTTKTARQRSAFITVADYPLRTSMLQHSRLTRRQLIIAAAAAIASSCVSHHAPTTQPAIVEPIIDIHQHTTYQGRSNEA